MTIVTLNIDFWPPFLVKYLRGELFNQDSLNSEQRDCLNQIADQIERQTKPPKPEEPTGLGAVAVDSQSSVWVRTTLSPKGSPAWRLSHWADDAPLESWRDLDIEKVEAEGVQS